MRIPLIPKIEIWKAIPGYDGLYEASNLGRIRSVDRIVKGSPSSKSGVRIAKSKILDYNGDDGKYRAVSLWKNSKAKWFLISHLILITFARESKKGEEVRHRDGDSTNDALYNLKWGTSTDNKEDKNFHGTHQLGSQGTTTKFTAEIVREIRLRFKNGERVTDLANEFRGKGSALDVIYGYTWTPSKYYLTLQKQIQFLKTGQTKVLPSIQRTFQELSIIDTNNEYCSQAEELMNKEGLLSQNTKDE